MRGVNYKSPGPAAATSWANAIKACQSLGLQLANIDADKRAVDLHGQLKTLFPSIGSYWLGASDAASEGNWTWLDKRTWSTSYLNWATGEPSNINGTEDCLVVRAVGSSNAWYAKDCNSTAVFVCEPPSGMAAGFALTVQTITWRTSGGAVI